MDHEQDEETSLPLMDSETAEKAAPQDPWKWATWRYTLHHVFKLSIMLLASFGAVQALQSVLRQDGEQEHAQSCSCGSSVAEALSMNCAYSPFEVAWLPPHCRDDELIEEFNHIGHGPNGTWQYYSDWDKSKELSFDEVASLADYHGHFFVSHEWHVQHCTYVWRKLFRSQKTGVTLPNMMNTYSHISHCTDMFLKRDPLDAIVTGSGVALNADIIPRKHKAIEPAIM